MKESFHLLVHSPRWPPQPEMGQAQARQKPGAKSFIQVSHVGRRDPSTWAILHCFSLNGSHSLLFPGHQQGVQNGAKWSSQDRNWLPYEMQHCRWWLYLLNHNAGPSRVNLILPNQVILWPQVSDTFPASNIYGFPINVFSKYLVTYWKKYFSFPVKRQDKPTGYI